MSNLRTLLTATALALAIAAPAQAEPVIKYPKMWEYLWNHPATNRSYNCDYTTRTCQDWRGGGDWKVFTLYEDDRETVRYHAACIRVHANAVLHCFNLDTGAAWYEDDLHGSLRVVDTGYIAGPDRYTFPWDGRGYGCNEYSLVCVSPDAPPPPPPPKTTYKVCKDFGTGEVKPCG
jgi:hypothetical protein